MSAARWITEAESAELLSLEEALEPLEAGLRRLADAGGVTIPKAMHAWAGGSMHALGAFDPETGLACFKTWINVTKGAVSLLQLFDVETGMLRAVIESGALGSMRTSGVTALATRELSSPEADTVAILGSGRQAQAQLGAIALVRPIREVRFWSPTPEKREAAAKAAAERFGLSCTASATLDEALADVPVIASVTRARDPFLRSEHLAPGTHLNAVGAILPGFSEVEPEVFRRASVLVADAPAGVAGLREVKDAAAADPTLADRTISLSDLLASGGPARAGGDLTIFKSIGIGASDLALAGEIVRRAEAQGVGRAIEYPKPTAPRWRANRS